MHWLLDLLYYRSLRRLHVLDRAHELGDGRRPLGVWPGTQTWRDSWR